MTSTYVIAIALALSACAHSAPGSQAPGRQNSYLGGRAGQPHSWPEQPNHGVVPGSPAGGVEVGPTYLGGRAAQPYGWINQGRDDNGVGRDPNYAYEGGRAGQPGSGPAER